MGDFSTSKVMAACEMLIKHAPDERVRLIARIVERRKTEPFYTSAFNQNRENAEVLRQYDRDVFLPATKIYNYAKAIKNEPHSAQYSTASLSVDQFAVISDFYNLKP